MEGVRVRFRGIGGSFFGAERPRGIAINLPGMPARVHATPIVPLMIECGYSVLQLQYFGTYDSQGNFDPRLAHRTDLESLRGIKNG